MQTVASEIPGSVLKVKVAVGAAVRAGEPVLIIESMKMEIAVEASHDGVISEVCVREGDQVEAGSPLVRINTEGLSDGD